MLASCFCNLHVHVLNTLCIIHVHLYNVILLVSRPSLLQHLTVDDNCAQLRYLEEVIKFRVEGNYMHTYR